MQKVLQSLLNLQDVDRQIGEVRAHLALFPKQLSEVDARVAATAGDLETSKAAQVATIKDRKKYELDVEQWKERVRKYKDQTAQVKTNEAYKALQHEVQVAEQEIANAEDRLLEQMVAGEEYDRRVTDSEALLKEVEDVARKSRARIDSEKATAERHLAELNSERERAVAQISDNLLDHYERIARKHNGIALAEVRDEMCSACGMRIRPHVFQEMRRPGTEEMFHCETCTRILYYIEPEPEPDAAAAPASPDSSSASAREN